MIFSVDAYQRLDRPFTYLATPNKDYIGIIQSRDLSNDLCFTNISETSFKVNKYEDGEPTPNYDSIDINMLVEITYVGWFQITDVEKQGDGNNECLTITALSLENEACSKTLTSFGQLGVETDEQGGLDRYCLSDITDTSHSILHIWLEKMPSWNIGFVDPEITKEYRTFSEDEVAAYSFLVDKVSETFECIFQFDTFEQTVSAYKLKNIGELTDIYLSYDNIIKKISVKSNSSDIKTVLTVTGGDDRGTPLGIIEVNPSGTNQIYNFSFYKNLMSEELRLKIDAYEVEYENRLNNFTPAIDVLQTLYEQLGVLQTKLPSVSTSTNWTEYGLAELNTKYNYYNERMSLYIGKTDSTSITNYNSNRVLRDAVESELKIRRSQITTKESQIANQKLLCESITLNLSDYLGTKLYKELSRYVHEDTFTDDTFVVTEAMTDAEALEMKRELLKMAQEKLSKVCKPSYSIEVDAINFTTIPEFMNFTKQLYLGNIITLDFGNDILVESRLLKLHINWDEPSDFSMTFSSKNKLDGFEYEFAEIQSQASTAGSAYGFNGTGWNNAKNKTNTFNQYMTSTLDLAKQKLQSSTNQEFTADSTGTLWRKWLENQNDYSPSQMWGTGNGLYLSQNKWNTVSMAIGEGIYNEQTIYGIWAPLICGDLMLTSKLHVLNGDNSIILNESGATFTNCNITINKGVNSIRLNASEGIQIFNGLTKQFYIDIDGNVTSAGKITGGSMNINNKFIVDSLGNLTANNAKLVNGVFSGDITGGSMNINNKFIVDSLGNLTANNARLVSGTFSGDITGGSMNINNRFIVDGTGDFYANTAKFGGDNSVTINNDGVYIKDSQGNTLTRLWINSFDTGFVFCDYLTVDTLSGIMIGRSSLTSALNSSLSFSPSNHSHSSDNIYAVDTGYGNINFAGFDNGAGVNWVQANFSPSTTSDFRLKKNIKALNDIPDELYLKLKPKQFEYKLDTYAKGIHFGLIAQQVENLFLSYGLNPYDYNLIDVTDVRKYTDDGMFVSEHTHRINYNNLITLNTSKIQKLYNILELQQKKIDDLIASVNELKSVKAG